MRIRGILHLALLCIGTGFSAVGDDWPSWRGPHHNGSTSERGLPSKIDPETNVRWRLDLPGSSSATPVVSGNRVFLVSNNSNASEVYAM